MHLTRAARLRSKGTTDQIGGHGIFDENQAGHRGQTTGVLLGVPAVIEPLRQQRNPGTPGMQDFASGPKLCDGLIRDPGKGSGTLGGL
eukprot:546437-Pyramimonas_sp.AAC.1